MVFGGKVKSNINLIIFCIYYSLQNAYPAALQNQAFEPYVDYANYHPYPIGNCGTWRYNYACIRFIPIKNMWILIYFSNVGLLLSWK